MNSPIESINQYLIQNNIVQNLKSEGYFVLTIIFIIFLFCVLLSNLLAKILEVILNQILRRSHEI